MPEGAPGPSLPGMEQSSAPGAGRDDISKPMKMVMHRIHWRRRPQEDARQLCLLSGDAELSDGFICDSLSLRNVIMKLHCFRVIAYKQKTPISFYGDGRVYPPDIA